MSDGAIAIIVLAIFTIGAIVGVVSWVMAEKYG